MTNTRKMALIAILSAVSFLLMYLKFPLIPSASFLEIDFSIIPILIGMLMLDLGSAFSILFIRTILKFLFNNNGPSTVIGLPMNIAALAVFMVALYAIWSKKQTLRQYLIASSVATIGLTLVMLMLNYVYAIPVYATFAHFDIGQILGVNNYLFGMVLPFNLLEGMLFSLVFYAVYRAGQPILRKL
ncbi:ECF transporter S component [Streptococcus azizii]|uniref:Riboflavin transporter n=1 Tax=Streptococcus azizii TaxID=1579424 RepID=A0AB36JUY6_9STRE|nr:MULTISPECIES: ECF transporter S component [Streptococcus]MBF0775287.1 ECF transporter S component [Streptococcus sp. 19428wD3_AN2]ONK29560.1 ECF transporter S component [Streptococcus azizii]ONK30069.1 ECF transporter S component [Streptococcus azizii]ONK30844.1 ECF transporter S component [Streptococcus azizii]TFU84812.1 ECF transporter S component [Streptococcus sp. AN2]